MYLLPGKHVLPPRLAQVTSKSRDPPSEASCSWLLLKDSSIAMDLRRPRRRRLARSGFCGGPFSGLFGAIRMFRGHWTLHDLGAYSWRRQMAKGNP